MATLLNALSNLLISFSSWIVIVASIAIVILVYLRIRSIRFDINQEINAPNVGESSIDARLLNEITPLKYYDYLRDEIKREDELTNHRLTWTLTFQGFLISASALLMIAPFEELSSLYILQRLALCAVGIIGLLTSLFSLTGILAARVSIYRARQEWEAKNELWKLHPKYLPQAFGQGQTFVAGTGFAERIPEVLAWMWCFFLVGYLAVTYLVDVSPCLESTSFLECLMATKSS